MINKFCFFFILFILSSVFGYIYEIIYFLIKDKKIILGRGFLIGPYCPVYGVGSLVMMILLYRFKSNPFIIFILGFIICSIIEYITGYLLEKIYKARWWDYRGKVLNINGRICLMTSIIFGSFGVFLIYCFYPIINNLVNVIPKNIFIIGTFVIAILFIIDLLISNKLILGIKIETEDKKKDITDDINRLIRKKYKKT